MDENEYIPNEFIPIELHFRKDSPMYQIEVLRIENADLRRLIQAERDVNAHMQILIDELRAALEAARKSS